jgi:hypothetical protein
MISFFVLCMLQLHENAYNTGRALQALVKVINPKSVDRRWSDDDAVRTHTSVLLIYSAESFNTAMRIEF